MENVTKQESQRADLLHRISTLKTADEQFIQWYVSTTANANFIRYPKPRDCFNTEEYEVYLPYQGKDEDLIFRMFRVFVSEFWPEFSIDTMNVEPIKYMIGIAAGTTPKQGIVLHGPVGSGKTSLIRVWLNFRQRILTDLRPDPHSRSGKTVVTTTSYITSQGLMRLFAEKGYNMFSPRYGELLVLDDIGTTIEGNHYGTRTNILAELICARYERWKDDPTIELYLTTNLLSGELAEVIGDRATSRLFEMAEWNSGTLTGEDRRRTGGGLKQWPIVKNYNPFNT